MTYGIPNDVLQPIFFGTIALLLAAFAWFVFIRKDRTFDKRFVAYAARTGLVYAPPVDIGSMTVGWETSTLSGQLEGVPVQLVASYHANARAAGVNGSSTFRGSARAPANVSLTLEIAPADGRGAPGRIATGDARFDALLRVESDNAQAAVMLLDPAVRAALAARPQGWGNCRLVYDRGAVAFEHAKFAYEPEHFDHGFRVVVAACSARLA